MIKQCVLQLQPRVGESGVGGAAAFYCKSEGTCSLFAPVFSPGQRTKGRKSSRYFNHPLPLLREEGMR
jgi:hypothetical protein